MPFVAAPNIVQCELRQLLDGQRIENRIFVNCFAEPTVADMNAIAGALSGAVSTNWVPLLPTTWRLTEFYLKSLHTQNAPEATYPQPAGSFTGTLGQPQLPNSNTLCISLRSNFSGRSARGRLYWPCLTEGQVVGNLVDQTVVNNIVSAVQDIDARISSTTAFEWVIVSFVSGGVPRPGGPVYFLVNGILAVDNVIDSQRRRLPGRGN